MNNFEYATPNTVEEACELLAETWGETEVLAGGTDLITCLKQRLTSPKRVVSLKNIAGLKEIKQDGDNLYVGSMATLAQLQYNGAPGAVMDAIKGIGARQMLAQGTVGGELLQRPRCWYFRNGYGLLNKELVEKGDNRYHAIFGNGGAAAYVHASSLAPALIAVGATAHIIGKGGTKREIPLAELFHTPGDGSARECTLKPNEILAGVSIASISKIKSATYEVRHRHSLDWPYVSASVAVIGRTSGSVVLGHVAPIPWKSEEASNLLNETADAANVAEVASAGATPLSGNAYKVALVKTAVKRAIIAVQA